MCSTFQHTGIFQDLKNFFFRWMEDIGNLFHYNKGNVGLELHACVRFRIVKESKRKKQIKIIEKERRR